MAMHSKLPPGAPPFRAEGLWNILGRLDSMLARAGTAFDAASTSSDQRPPDVYLGPYTVSGDGQRLIRRQPDEPALAAASVQEARFHWLQQVFGLDTIDLDFVIIALAAEVDLRYELQFSHLQGLPAPRPASLDLALNLLCASRDAKLMARSRFAPQAPLLRHRLLQLVPEPSTPQPSLLAHYLKLEESVVRFLLGEAWLDMRLRAFARLDPPLGEAGARAAAVAELMSAELAGGGTGHFSLEGPCSDDRDAAVASLATRLRMGVLGAALDQHSEAAPEFACTLQALLRDARLHDALVYLSGVDGMGDTQRGVLAEVINGAGSGIVIIMSSACGCGPRFRTMASIPVAPSSFAERRALWAAQLRRQGVNLDAPDIDELAARYRLSESQIKEALARSARQCALHHDKQGCGALSEAARLQSVGEPGPLARKLSPVHGWDDLVLPPPQMALLKQLCSQARYRHVVYDDWGFDRKLSNGKGLSALFTGPPGTGKTMAVEVIANDLGLEVFKIDLSQVVSKYIGETEKALDRLFAQARAGNAILFFDECDALFGKRTTVQDAHDRYANIEVAYLLQKLEEHEGLSILATNLRQNLDVGFTRRLSFIVEFPFPDEESRRRLWRSIWPEQVPRSQSLDLDFMASQFKLSGGAVKNIALAAAFLAARDGCELRTEHLLCATRSEIEKSGQRLAPSQFGRYADQMAEGAS